MWGAEEDEDAVKMKGVHRGSLDDLISCTRLVEAGKGPTLCLNALLQTPVEMNSHLCKNNHLQ